MNFKIGNIVRLKDKAFLFGKVTLIDSKGGVIFLRFDTCAPGCMHPYDMDSVEAVPESQMPLLLLKYPDLEWL